MKYTLCVTLGCNLQCKYCYITKENKVMSMNTVDNVINFMYNQCMDDKLNIGFFGGEPLLEIELIKKITERVKEHPNYDENKVFFGITTNGTIYSEEIVDYVLNNSASFCISIDGTKEIQDQNRIFMDGSGSFEIVNRNLKKYMKELPLVLVNSVYTPGTLKNLGDTVSYLRDMGLRHIYINPDYSAPWSIYNLPELEDAYRKLKEIYINAYIKEEPLFISIIDSKIAAILRGGYQNEEKCQMGIRDFAFSPSGNIFPCERLIGDGEKNEHCIGNVNEGYLGKNNCCFKTEGHEINQECITCSLRPYCMNWCGCTNYFSSGYYNRVGPFICASEKYAIQISFEIIEEIPEQQSYLFSEHLSGKLSMNL